MMQGSRYFILLVSVVLISFNYCWSVEINEQSSSILFTENKGQWHENVYFKANLGGGTVFLERNGLTYLVSEKVGHHHCKHQSLIDEEVHSHEQQPVKHHAFNFKWINLSPTVHLVGMDKQSAYENYFIGNDTTKWKSNVRNYKTLLYNNIYTNINAKIYSQNNSLKIDYIIKKGGNIQNIKLQYNGVDDIKINRNGQLEIKTSVHTLIEMQPYVYQIIDGVKIQVSCKYVLNNNVLSFQLLENYNKNYDLIVDPTLIFSTYSGSAADNWGSSATYDSEGNMFLGGIALEPGYPTTLGAFQTNFAGGFDLSSLDSDIVITKFNSTGTDRIYSTHLGGSKNELLKSLYCTPNNELVVLLVTGSSDYPTTVGAFDRTFNGGLFNVSTLNLIFDSGTDIAITRLNILGTALVGSTYYGGSRNDGIGIAYNYGDDTRGDIAITNNGDIIICSSTNSTNLPNTFGRFQPNYGGGNRDGFIARFNSNLRINRWSSYFGSTGVENANGITLDKNENIFICGVTNSNNLPGRNLGLIKNLIGSSDGYVSKINSNATQVLATTYLGTPMYDQAFLLDTDGQDNIVVFGQTVGNYAVTSGVYFDTLAPQFIHKLNNNLDSTIFSTVFGHTSDFDNITINISPTALLVDVCGNIYAVGWGGVTNAQGNTLEMPTTNDAFQQTTDGSDFYFINFNNDATQIIYATYFGEDGVGDHVDGGTSRFDKNGIVYQAVCASCGGFNSFPTTIGAYSNSNNSSNCNMAGFKFKFDLDAIQIITILANTSCTTDSVEFSYTSTQPATSVLWDFGDGQTASNETPVHRYISEGNYLVKLTIGNSINCNVTDSASILINVRLNKTTAIDTFLCDGDTLFFNQQIITQEGIYRDTLTAHSGCDSFVNLQVKRAQNYLQAIDSTICEGKHVQIGDSLFSKQGNYNITLKTVHNCDSNIVLNLNVLPTKYKFIDTAICFGTDIKIGSSSYQSNGNYYDTLVSSIGCDSVINLKLTVLPNVITTIKPEICEGDTFVFENIAYTQSENYTIIYKDINNCDSFLNIQLTVHRHEKTDIYKEICDGDSLIVGNTSYKTSGFYTHLLQTVKGCDSIVNIELVVNEHKTITIDTTICFGDSIRVGANYFKSAGQSTTKLQTTKLCDSVVTLNLALHPEIIINAIVDKDIIEKGEIIQLDIEANDNLLAYSWSPANLLLEENNKLKNPTAMPTQPTWFIVEATNSNTNCTVLDSVFVNILILPCNKDYIYIPNAFTPNGDNVNDVFKVRSKNLISGALIVYDRWGNKIYESDDINKGWDGTYKGVLQQQDVYGFYFSGTCDGGETTVIKGNVILLK